MSQHISHLLTYHGTLVYVDDNGIVRAGPLETSPLNFGLIRDGSRAYFAVIAGAERVPIDRFTKDSIQSSGNAASTAVSLAVQICDGGVLQFQVNGLFVAAEKSGHLTLNRPYSEIWETFFPISPEDLTFARFVKENDWFSCSLDRVLRKEEVVVGENFRFKMASIDLSLTELFMARTQSGKYCKDLFLSFDGWKAERLRLFKPLIYYGAFGDSTIFECLRVSVQSLAEFGAYSGEFAVISDRSLQDILPYFPTLDRQPIVVATAAVESLDFMAARFRIAQHKIFDDYQPILYADTDLVCDTNIEPLLISVLKSNKFCVCEEKPLDEGFWFGWPLFQQDDTAVPQTKMGFTTGLMGWPNMEMVEPLLNMILSVVYLQAARIGNRTTWDCFDQPVANYVVNKIFEFDTTALRNSALLPEHHEIARTVERVGGFRHFCGNVGGGIYKIDRMRQCLDDLRKEKAEEIL